MKNMHFSSYYGIDRQGIGALDRIIWLTLIWFIAREVLRSQKDFTKLNLQIDMALCDTLNPYYKRKKKNNISHHS